MRCRYCDTAAAVEFPDPKGVRCRVQKTGTLNGFEEAPNPVSSAELTEFCKRFIIRGPSRPVLSLTGGEPLLHCSFLAEWLPVVRSDFSIYLETNGVHAGALRDLRGLIDVVSMDFKLPSATGRGPFWEEHKQFLSAARGKTIFVKAVVTRETTRDDIMTAASVLSEFGASIPFILQPASGAFAPDAKTLIDFQEAALGYVADVRVIPQAHKILNLP